MAKVIIRDCEFEYLKKRGCYGVFVQKTHVMVHGNEAVNQREDPVEIARSYLSTLRVWSWRGGNPVYAEQMGLMFARFKLNYRATTVIKRGQSRTVHAVYPSAMVIYTPGIMGGIGHMARDMYSSSVDGVIINKMGNDIRFNRLIQLGAKVIYKTGNKDIDEYTQSFWDTAEVTQGSGTFNDFKEHLDNTRDDYRYYMAGIAADRLEGMGVPNIAKRLDYRFMGQATTERMLSSTPQMLDLQYKRLGAKGQVIHKNMMIMAKVHNAASKSMTAVAGELPDVAIPDSMLWITKVRFDPTGIMQPLHPKSTGGSPFNGNAAVPYIALGKHYGVSTSAAAGVLTLKSLINKLYEDPKVRRDISIESIAEILLSLIHDSELMLWALVRMGSLVTYASSVIQDIVQHKALYMAAATAARLGSFMSDQLLPNLDINPGVIAQILPSNISITEGSAAYSMLTAMIVSRQITDYITTGQFFTYAIKETQRSFKTDYFKLVYGIRSNAVALNKSLSEILEAEQSKVTSNDVLSTLVKHIDHIRRNGDPILETFSTERFLPDYRENRYKQSDPELRGSGF
jgi:hypothetical protein